jgi:hypothetical protein
MTQTALFPRSGRGEIDIRNLLNYRLDSAAPHLTRALLDGEIDTSNRMGTAGSTAISF